MSDIFKAECVFPVILVLSRTGAEAVFQGSNNSPRRVPTRDVLAVCQKKMPAYYALAYILYTACTNQRISLRHIPKGIPAFLLRGCL